MRGRGTFDQDRPPIAGAMGRASHHVRLRVIPDTTKATLHDFVHRFTSSDATVYTDELKSYSGIHCTHHTVAHGHHEWAHDETGSLGIGASISIRWKGGGLDCAPSCVRFAASANIY
jgi:hypothetical protein